MATYKQTKDEGCCSVNFLKYVLFIFNFVFFLAGCAVLGVGIWTVIYKCDYVMLLSTSTYVIIAYLLIIAGCLTLIGSIIGCIGIWIEGRCALLLYTFLLMLIFATELTAGVMAYVYEQEVYNELDANLNATFINNYKMANKDEITNEIDSMQRTYKCCGSISYEDWLHSPLKKDKLLKSNPVPDSCCYSEGNECAMSNHPSNIYYTGCIHKFSNSIREHLIILGAVGLGICLVQIFGIILASCLYIRLKDYEEMY